MPISEELKKYVAKCKACQAPIVWMKTKAGKNNPVDLASITTDEHIFNPCTMISHFATCKFADKFRKKKRP